MYLKYINKDSHRLSLYSRNKKLYEGEHYDVFNIRQFEYYTDPANQYIAYNYPEILTNAFNNLIWSEDPTISFKNPKNQEFFENFISHDGFFIKMRQATETSSHSGDAVIQILVDEVEPGKYGILTSQIENCMWFPIYDENNPSKPAKGHIIYFEKKVNSDKDTAILLEIHTAGQIEWEAYLQKTNDKEPSQVSPMNYFSDVMGTVLIDPNMAKTEGRLIYKTNCRYPLVFHLPNHKTSGCFFGKSDYTVPVISKVYAMNQNYNQIQYVLKKHAHPKMIVPKEVIKQAIKQITSSEGGAKEYGFESMEKASRLASQERSLFETLVAQKLIDKLEFYGSDVNSSDPKYLTWDGNLSESREQINMLKQATFEETQLAKVLIDPDVSLGSASGVAILRLAQPSLHKAIMKQAYIRDVMGKMIYTILELAKNTQVEGGESLDPEIPSIKFRDGLVNDLKELIENQTALIDSQLTTKIDAIMATQDLSQEQAQSKYNEILQENNLFAGDMPGNQNNQN